MHGRLVTMPAQLYADQVQRIVLSTFHGLLPDDYMPALRSTDERAHVTFHQLNQLVSETSLVSHGIHPCDRLCSMLNNGAQAICAFLAFSWQCVHAPINSHITPELAFELEDLAAAAVVLQDNILATNTHTACAPL